MNLRMSTASPGGYCSPASLAWRNHLCVLPLGGRPPHGVSRWTALDLAPYVGYMPAGKPAGPMFGGFILSGIRSRPGRFLYPMYAAFGKPADRDDWLQWIDDVFAPGHNLDALCMQADGPLDIWVSIPYPHPLQSDFGLVDGKRLDFRTEEDRYRAVAWWIDRFSDRFADEAGLAGHIHFRGFLWPRASIDAGDEPLVERTNHDVHAKGFRSIWLPHYGGQGALKSGQLGFDAAAVHPNYYGNAGYGVEWLDQAALFAKMTKAGFQIICGKGALYSDYHLLDYLNHGLPEKNGYMHDALLVYQFPNQTLGDLIESRPDDYERLHAFIRGTYTKAYYPGIAY